MIGDREGQVGAAHRAAARAKPGERLRAGDFMDEVAVDEDQGGTVGALFDNMRVPDFLVKGAGPGHAVHLSLSDNNASEWRSKTQFSVAAIAVAARAPGAYIPPMSVVAIILLVLATVAAMESVAWASHKYIMHGFGWAWHRDHHEPHDRLLEKNDLFAIFGAAMSISMFAAGSPMIMGASAWEPGTWIGLGVLFYGIIYTLVHDGLVHQRYFRWVPRRGYAKRLVQAHKLHHATIGKEGGVSFGFVLARDPAKLKAELKVQREAGIAVVREALAD
jgi:beta-carotene 3-hydroxylase